MPKSYDLPQEQLDQFASNCVLLRAEFILCSSPKDLNQKLTGLARESGWRNLAAHKGKIADAAVTALGLPTLIVDEGYDIAELERADAAVTECDALIAQTGSVLITSKSAGGRCLSALTPHHVVVATKEQMVADLKAAFDLLEKRYSGNYPSLISLITGPSRTGDIERILVLGAHGPKRLTIFCVEGML
jgi:L-lactate dehydrogenase complex protein LldG